MSAGRLERRATALAAAFALACVAASAAGCSSPDGGGGDGSGPGGSRGSEQRSAGQQGQSGGGDAGGAEQSVKRPDPPKAEKEPPAEFSQDGFRVPSNQEGKLTDVRVGTGTAAGGGSDDSGDSGGGESSGSNDGSGGEQDGQSKPVETVTFDLGTGKLPEYHVRYVEAVRAHPAEQPIDVAGNAYLEVGFELTDPNKKGQLAIPPNTRPGQPLVKQTLLVRNVGGEVRFAIGLAEKVKFRARQEGGSLVIELRTG